MTRGGEVSAVKGGKKPRKQLCQRMLNHYRRGETEWIAGQKRPTNGYKLGQQKEGKPGSNRKNQPKKRKNNERKQKNGKKRKTRLEAEKG